MRPAHRSARAAAIALAFAMLAAIATPAHADNPLFPQGPPDDPAYDRAEENPVQYAPSDEQTYFYSFLPVGAPGATDPENASGMSIDKAWADYSIGRADTVIAYIEAGINWRSDSIPDLADKVYLNRGELPMTLTDTNGDGWISAPDVPGVDDENGNGFVDAEDVIATYSDGVDDDHNGYVDDISGWDFYDHQNDPATYDSAYEHSDGQMRQAAAITNNGFGEAGICPRCMILPIKAGAEALDRTDDLAQAWLYATDLGADVIVSVTADLGYSSFMRQAVEYAEHHGVVAVESSNDFDSTDHQGGMWWPHVLPGNGMVSNAMGTQPGTRATTTYRARSGLTSWGTHNVFTAATTGGSTSESTPTVGGVAALLLSYGKTAAKLGLIDGPLTNFEAVQVLRATASDVDDATLPWPGKPGWDLQYGYGRPNAWKAMKAVHDGDIPPVGTIESPQWYSYVDPTRQQTLRVTGHVEAPRSSAYHWELQMGLGPEPSDADFHVVGSGQGTQPFDGTLANIDLSQIPTSFTEAPFALSDDKALSSTERYTVSLRLRVWDADDRMGEDRRSFFARHDDSLVDGFPLKIGSGGDSQPALADLNGDGRLDIVFGDSDGRVHAISSLTRRELPGWPALTNPTKVVKPHAGVNPGHEPVVANVAVGDLDHTGKMQVVATSTTGRVYVFEANGTRRPGWPRVLANGVTKPPIPRPDLPFTRLPTQGATATPLLADLDGDHRLEVVQAGWDGYLHVYRPNGTNLPGWPVRVVLPDDHPSPPGMDVVVRDMKLDSPPTLADLDGDGSPEIVQNSQYTNVRGADIQPGGIEHVFAFHADGTPVDGWPNDVHGIVEYYGSAQEFITEGCNSPVAANVDGLPGDEIVTNPVFSPSVLIRGDGRAVQRYGPTPSFVPGHTDVPVGFTTSGAFGMLNGVLTFAQPGSGGSSIASSLLTSGSGTQLQNFERAFEALSGAPQPGFPAFLQGLNFLGAPLLVDVTGDGAAEIVDGGDSNAVHAFDGTGAQAAGFPKFNSGWGIWSPTAGDLDGDGKVEILQATREGYLFAWHTDGLASANTEWWRYHHDEWNTGRYGMDTRPPGALLGAAWHRAARTVTFTAPGDDWYAGRAKAYVVRFGTAAPKRVTATADAGAKVTLHVPAGVRRVTVRAVDDAGNLGRLRSLATT